MQPTRELTEQLFRACPNRVREHFYDHVVSSDAVLPLVVAQGPTGRRLCFNYAERSSTDMVRTQFKVYITMAHLVNVFYNCQDGRNGRLLETK